MKPPGAIILAAGNSSRMGRPKQLIPWDGDALVVRAAHAAIRAGASPVWVVTGAYAAEVADALQEEPVRILPNERFQEGMGTSIAAGFHAALSATSTGSVFLLLCDQPEVDPTLLERMESTAAESGRGLVACAYAGTVGPPLLVQRRFFAAFAGTPPGAGAKAVLVKHADELAVVPFEAGARDLDEPGDL